MLRTCDLGSQHTSDPLRCKILNQGIIEHHRREGHSRDAIGFTDVLQKLLDGKFIGNIARDDDQ